MPPQRNYAQKKYESDSEEDTKSVTSSTNIKTEDEPTQSNELETIEPKIKCEEVSPQNPVEENDTNVTICHDSNEQEKSETEVETKQEPIAEPMEH